MSNVATFGASSVGHLNGVAFRGIKANSFFLVPPSNQMLSHLLLITNKG